MTTPLETSPVAPALLHQPLSQLLEHRRVFQVGSTYIVRGPAEREWLQAHGVSAKSILTAARMRTLLGRGRLTLARAAQKLSSQ